MKIQYIMILMLVLVIITFTAFYIDKDLNNDSVASVDKSLGLQGRVIYRNVINTDMFICEDKGMVTHNNTHCIQYY